MTISNKKDWDADGNSPLSIDLNNTVFAPIAAYTLETLGIKLEKDTPGTPIFEHDQKALTKKKKSD